MCVLFPIFQCLWGIPLTIVGSTKYYTLGIVFVTFFFEFVNSFLIKGVIN